MSRGLLEAPRPTLLQGLELTHIRAPGHAREGRAWESRELATEGRPLWQPAGGRTWEGEQGAPPSESPGASPKAPQHRTGSSAQLHGQLRTDFPAARRAARSRPCGRPNTSALPTRRWKLDFFPPKYQEHLQQLMWKGEDIKLFATKISECLGQN